MNSSETKRLSLFQALEAKGWFWEDDRFYPAHKTFWMEGDDPPEPTLRRMYQREKPQLEKMPEIEHFYSDKEGFQKWVEDTKSFVDTLEELLGIKRNP